MHSHIFLSLDRTVTDDRSTSSGPRLVKADVALSAAGAIVARIRPPKRFAV